MAFAAAAVSAARSRGSGGMAVPLRSPAFRCSGPTVACCASAALIPTGFVMLVSSFNDNRATLVSDYDLTVQHWLDSAREEFASTDMRLAAVGDTVSGGGAWRSMQASESEERAFHDSEQNDGLLEYVPLRFEATVHLETYYTNSSRHAWEPLPSLDEAIRMTLQLSLRNSNGSYSVLELPSFALAYDRIVHPRTPAPEGRCRRENDGYWQSHQCHVTTRLTKVCVQLHQDQDGGWSLQPRAGSTDGAAIGCDAKKNWRPDSYTADSCWGPKPHAGCKPEDEEHRVQVTVRSAADPFLRAEELTDNSFDFGLSPRSKRVYGLTVFALGCLFLVAPSIVIGEWLYRRRKRKNEENVPLEGARCTFHDEADCTVAGIYGHRRV